MYNHIACTTICLGFFDSDVIKGGLKSDNTGEFLHRQHKYTQYGYIRTTVNVSVLVVLIFSQNFSTNGPYVVLNFCKFSDTMVLIF